MIKTLLGSIGEGGSFGSTDFALWDFLCFYYVWVDIGLFGSWGILDISRQIDASVVTPFTTILCYFAVGFGIEILWFDCRDISYIAWYMWINRVIIGLLLLMRLVAGCISHVSNDRTFFGAGSEHVKLYILFYILFDRIKL